MVTFELEVNHRKIFRHHKHYPQVGDTVNYVRFHFTFKGKAWKDTVRTAVFKSRSFNISRQALIDQDGYCLVPQEILGTYGIVLCSVYGVATEGGEVVTRITTDPVDVLFIKDGIHKAPGGPALTPTEYESFIAEVREYITHIKTSDLINDMNFPSDASYVHTDNNFTTEEKSKLASVAEGAEVNVNADWGAVSGDAEIFNKPTIPENVSDLTDDVGILTEEVDPVFLVSPAADITSEDIAKWNTPAADFVGATASVDGEHGLVPAPGVGGNDKVLSADGNWYNVKIMEYLDLDNNDQGLLIALKDDSNVTKHGYTFSFKSGINILKASTSDYGFAKLSSSVTSTSEALAATSKAVKTAYDLADSKQDELVSGTNIKTINNTSLLGSGNIDIQSGGGNMFIAEENVTSAADIIDAYNAGDIIYLQFTTSAYGTLYAPCVFNQISTTEVNLGYISPSRLAICGYNVQDAGGSTTWLTLSEALQAKLVSGSNIKTINGESILGSGNISVAADYIVETGTSDGWSYRKWQSGRIEAEKDVSTGSSWSTVGSTGIAYDATTLTPPTGMTVTGGYANLKTTSQYIIGAQIQIDSSSMLPVIKLEVHRLASSSTSFNFHVTLIGTYS